MVSISGNWFFNAVFGESFCSLLWFSSFILPMERTSRVLFGAAILLSVHCFIVYASPMASSTDDQSALLAFKSHLLSGSNNIFLEKNWTAESSVCSWMGVVCGSQNNRVTSLDISDMGLNGSISPDIGKLSFLIVLDLSNNFFHGNFPQVLAQLQGLKYLYLGGNNFSGVVPPSIFSSLSNLQVLDLSQNRFSGSIPAEIGDLRFLRILNLQFNLFSGPIPPGIFNMSLLEIIALTWNDLSGNLPADIGFNLPKLQGLHLSKNEFSGQIPASLGNCSQLHTLSLSYNAFSGVIPREIGNLALLQHLHLNDNYLTGTIPAEIGNLQRLQVFSAFDNSLRGSIPHSIFNISELRKVLLGKNQLSGNLPASLGQGIPNVDEINLVFNQLTGTIPATISNASKLIYLSLAFNSFTSFIPETLGNLRSLKILNLQVNNLKSKLSSSSELSIITSLTNCRNLTYLDIAWNPLYGVLPASVGNLSAHLKIFDVSNSSIIGYIPEEIGNLSSVLRLNLAGNELTGLIPRTVEGLLSVQELYMQNNHIQGSLPDTICRLQNLGYMELGGNQFSGLVPSCIGNNTSLRYLYLDSNNFSSSLPPSFWTLKYLLEFTASSNSLSGYIPPEIGNLRVLTDLDLSMNSLHGNIPTTVGNLQNLLHLSLAQNRLEGSIPDSFSQALSLELLDLSNNKLTGGIPQSLETLVYLRKLNVSFNGLRGQIPTGGPFQNFTASSFMSNAALCGAPRFQVLPCPISIQSNQRSRFLLIVYVFLGIFSLIVVSLCFVFTILRYRIKKRADVEKSLSPLINQEGISYLELQTMTNGFSEGNLLAAGSYSSIYEGILSDGTHAVVKAFNFKLGRALETFQTECQILSNIRHRNLTAVITSCGRWDLEFGALVLEYMPNGSLEKWLYSHNYCLGILERLDIMIDVANALDYLHSDCPSQVVHCDVKPSNVLLDEEMVAHLCDFGIAKLLAVRDGLVRSKTIGTMGYLAPEYGTEGSVSTKCDVYSYGIMLMETFTRRRPWDDMFTGDITLRSWIKDSIPNAVNQVVDCNLLKPEEADLEAKLQFVSSVMELALHCTASSPAARMNMHDVLSVLTKLRRQLLVMCYRISSSKCNDII